MVNEEYFPSSCKYIKGTMPDIKSGGKKEHFSFFF